MTNVPKHVGRGSGAVSAALHALAAGRAIVVADDADRENEGDLIVAAEHTTPEMMAFLLRHGSGIVCTPMSNAVADRLELDPMVNRNTDNHETAFTVSVDHIESGTGISAVDRAKTAQALSNSDTSSGQLRRPGHVFPLRARDGGVSERRGHTEAAVELTQLAGCSGIATITELVDDAGVPLSGSRLTDFATMHGLVMITIDDLVAFQSETRIIESADKTGRASVIRTGIGSLPTRFGQFHALGYRSESDGIEHLVLIHGDFQRHDLTQHPVLTRVHSECLTGDLVGSLRCDCGTQLQSALSALAAEDFGILVYVRGHEGRGVGLGAKMAAYALQDTGLDTVDANIALGLPVDDRDYGVAAAILMDLSVSRIRLITNNYSKVTALIDAGVDVVDTVHLEPSVTSENLKYLITKRDRLGHALPTHLSVGQSGRVVSLVGEAG